MYLALRNKLAGLKAVATAAAVGSLFAANSAMALTAGLAGAESTVLGYVAGTVGFIVAVGVAVLGMVMVAKAIKWARRAG